MRGGLRKAEWKPSFWAAVANENSIEAWLITTTIKGSGFRITTTIILTIPITIAITISIAITMTISMSQDPKPLGFRG